MQKSRVKLVAVLMIVGLVVILSGCASKTSSSSTGTSPVTSSGTSSAQPFKVAMLVTGPANDGGWDSAAMAGLAKIKANLGAQTAYTENVAQSDQAQIMRNYASEGYNLIIGDGFEYSDALKQVASEYPNVKFAGIGSEGTAPNLAVMTLRYGEDGYLLGVLCGSLTKTNKIGIVTATPDPTGKAEFDNVKTEAQAIDPKATVTIAYTGSWSDVAKAKEAALAQIADGCDIIIADCDVSNKGVFQAVVEKNVQAVGWSEDQHDQAPNNILTSAVEDMSTLVYLAGEYYQNGTFTGQVYALGVKEGAQGLGSFDQAVPPALQATLKQDEQSIANGSITPVLYNPTTD
jgi:basic membrane protein A